MSDDIIKNNNNVIEDTIVRRAASGERVEELADRRKYKVPPTGQYRLAITGYYKPFAWTSKEYGDSTKTRIEFRIESDYGRGNYLNDMYTWSVGPKSNLGKLIRKARGVEIPEGDVNLFELILPREPIVFDCYVTNSDEKDEHGAPKYARVTLDTVTPAAALAGAGADAKYDPFNN
jgi:hypothetical protein